MQKVLFAIQRLKIGGIQKSLIEMLHMLPKDKFEVHVLYFHPKKVFLPNFPQDIFLHQAGVPSKDTLLSLIKTFHWIEALVFLSLWIYGRLCHNEYRFLHHKYCRKPDFMDGFVFDLAIAYHGSAEESSYYLCEKVRAKTKCMWIHEDVAHENFRYEMMKRFSSDLSKIILTSEKAQTHFNQKFPFLSDQSEVIRNIISKENIIHMAKEGRTFTDKYEGKRILTVGRFHHIKGQQLAIKALKILLERGKAIKWYFVGNGESLKDCMKLAKRIGVDRHVVFLGAETNPYAYMRDCDVYVQPSLHESFCMTLGEALCFANPIVCTDFCGVDQMNGRPNGYITDISAEAIADGIEKALNDKRIEVAPTQDTSNTDKLLQQLKTLSL